MVGDLILATVEFVMKGFIEWMDGRYPLKQRAHWHSVIEVFHLALYHPICYVLKRQKMETFVACPRIPAWLYKQDSETLCSGEIQKEGALSNTKPVAWKTKLSGLHASRWCHWIRFIVYVRLFGWGRLWVPGPCQLPRGKSASKQARRYTMISTTLAGWSWEIAVVFYNPW